MNLGDEKPLLTLDDYWRDLERSVYADAPPLVKTHFRELFYAGATTAITMCNEMMKETVPETESLQRLDALHNELYQFAKSDRNEAKAPPPEGGGRSVPGSGDR